MKPLNNDFGGCVGRHAAFFFLTLSLTIFLSTGVANAQGGDNLMPSKEVLVSVDSGNHFNHGDKPEVVWSEEIHVKEAEWLRLHFSHLMLGYDHHGGTSSILRITSLRDEAVQILDTKSARQWRNKTAFFNGNSVRLELIAHPNGRLNKVVVDRAFAGLVPASTESICDGTDDRLLSNDPRAGRTSGGCTGWLFNDRRNCMLTAGHCASSTDVMLFNVPLSNPNGSYNFPGPEDQYAVDPDSVQAVNGGIGNDWSYFGCFENSNTGLTAFEAQGSSYQFEIQNISFGDPIRITGYGTTSNPVDPRLNGAQKTQLGPTEVQNGTALGYRTDTTGGNSGSPVILESTGVAIGIHTHGGCNNGGGNNWGTSANNPGFQDALASPLGVCQASVGFEFTNGRPLFIDPNGGTAVRVVATNEGVAPEPGTGRLHYNDGSGFASVPMVEISPNVYDAIFPATRCGSVVEYYFTAEDDAGGEFTNPQFAPEQAYSVISGTDTATIFDDNFEANLGWTVTGDASTGQWERAIPSGGGSRGDPPTDGDGSGNCFVTQNGAGDTDVDNGSTILTSPVMDASLDVGERAIASYYLWYDSSVGTQDDVFNIEVSNNNGASWTTVRSIGPTGFETRGGWVYHSFEIADFVAPTAQVRLRFTAIDVGSGSVVEAGVDGVSMTVVNCQQSSTTDSFEVENGIQIGGDVNSLQTSDGDHLLVRRNQTQLDGIISMTFDTVSHAAFPVALEVKLEASVLARRDVTQTIELFNYQTGEYELIDSRSASRSGDVVVTASASGDLDRFVEPGSRAMQTRIQFKPLSRRQTYSTRIDELLWTVTN